MPDPTGTRPKYSPGMDGDPNGAILENWSTTELETWFREHVESDPQFSDADTWSGIDGVKNFPKETREGLRAINAGLTRESTLFGHDAATAFGRLAPETRDTFFFAWTETHQAPPPVINPDDAEWTDLAAVGTLITLPDGTQITDDLSDPNYEPSGSDVPPPSTEVPPRPWWRTPRAIQWVVVGAITIIVVAGAVIIVGDSDSAGESQPQSTGTGQDTPDTTVAATTESPGDTITASDAPAEDSQATDQQSDAQESTTDSAIDPVGDISQAFPDLDGVDPERSVGGYPGQDAIDSADVTELTVVSSADGNTTTIAIGFNGDAQGINTEESGTLMSRSLGGDVLISPPEGRILNVLFRRDGTIKISDIPSGMAIKSEWLTPGEFLIVITGLAVNPGTQVEAIVLLEAYGGFMSDVVSLITTSP